MTSLYILSMLYGIAGLIYLIIAVRKIITQNGIRVFDFSRLMYSMIFGLIPMLIYWKEASGERNLFYTNYTSDQLLKIYLLFALSIFIYAVLNLSYGSIRKKAPQQEMGQTGDDEQEDLYKGKNLYVAGVIALGIGWISLILWTRAYGSITNFVLNANAIRSGHGAVSNTFAFMKHFVRLMSVSLYAILSAYFFIKPRGFKRIIHLTLIVISIVGNYYYTLASDSRISIMFVGLAFVAILLRHRKKANIGRYIVLSGLVVFGLLIVVMNADTFTRYVRYGIWKSSDSGVIESIVREFRFTLSSEMRAIEGWFDGKLRIKLLDEFLNSIVSWIPERFIPFNIPDTVWTYNTNIYGAVSSGTSPSDILATSIYEIGILGPIVHPFVWGQIIGTIDKRLWTIDISPYPDVYYGVFLNAAVMQISHNQFSSFVLSMFPAFVFFLITWILEQINHRRIKT